MDHHDNERLLRDITALVKAGRSLGKSDDEIARDLVSALDYKRTGDAAAAADIWLRSADEAMKRMLGESDT